MNMENISHFNFLEQIIEEYEKGNFSCAFQKVLSSPVVCYESLACRKDFFLFILINFIDACVFKGEIECYQTFNVLIGYIFQTPLIQTLFEAFYKQIRMEEFIFLTLQKKITSSSDSDLVPEGMNHFFQSWEEKKFEEAEQLLFCLPKNYQSFFKKKMAVEKGWQAFEKSRINLALWIKESEDGKNQPWHPFAYKVPLTVFDLKPEGKIPLIFLEPLEEINYENFLTPYLQKECILIVETVAHFYHLLQFDFLQKIWSQPQVILYILDLYPSKQFDFQNYKWKEIFSLRPLFMTKRLDFEKKINLFEEVLSQSLVETQDQKIKSEGSKNLYELSKERLLERETKRYGPERTFALNIGKGISRWFSLYKEQTPLDGHLKLNPTNYLEKEIQNALKKRKARVYSPKKKVFLIHVVPQIVDGGHAPTRLLKILCALADRQWFDLLIYSTERLVDRALEYPSVTYVSPPSSVRGSESIKYFEKIGVKVLLDPQSPTFETTAKNCQNTLDQLQADLVLFHGPDEINSWCSAHTTTPLRLLFEHGSLPSYPCFDLAILSTEEAYEKHYEAYHKQGMESCFLPFSVDVKQEWLAKPFTRKELNLPENAFILTTISHHLENRMSKEMFSAIGLILKKCPQAIYAPIGPINCREKWMRNFEKDGVEKQIFPLGNRNFPSQLARSMNLYLNEFPFGSGIAILEAMAAGCPVVSMYDPKGPPQGRYGGTYFGLDHVIHSGRLEDYVELACQLINDADMYKEWSQYALKQYEKRVDVTDYVKKFEKILDKFIAYFLRSSSFKPPVE